jgi:hypothetical protein
VFVNNQFLGIRTAANYPHYLVADGQCTDSLSKGSDPARELHSWDLRGRRSESGEQRARIKPTALQQIGSVECRRNDVDQDLFGTGDRFRHFSQPENINFAIFS